MKKHLKEIHKKDVYSINWNFDDKIIFTTSADHTINLWNSDTCVLIKTLNGH